MIYRLNCISGKLSKSNEFFNIFKVLTKDRKILIPNTYKTLMAPGLEPAPPGNRPDLYTFSK